MKNKPRFERMFYVDFKKRFEKFPFPFRENQLYFHGLFSTPKMNPLKSWFVVPDELCAENYYGVAFYVLIETTHGLFEYTKKLIKAYTSEENYGYLVAKGRHKTENKAWFMVEFVIPRHGSFLHYFDLAEKLLVKSLTRDHGFRDESWNALPACRKHKEIDVSYYMVRDKEQFDSYRVSVCSSPPKKIPVELV